MHSVYMCIVHAFVAIFVLLISAVLDPLLHDGMVGVQVDGDVLVLGVQHVAQLLQTAVLRAPTGGVAQVVHNPGYIHLT